MNFKKNTAVTGFAFALVSATDGSAITTGTVTGYVLIDGGTQATLTNSAIHEGNGQWSVDLTAAEMNGDVVGLLFTHSSAIPVHFTIHTDTKRVSELNDLSAANVNAEVDTAIGDAALATASALATVDSNVDAILVDTNELQTNQGDWATATGFATAANLATVDANVDAILEDTGTTIPGTLSDMTGATFNSATDSLEAIRDRGDAAWTTGGGGGGGGDATEAKQDTIIAALAVIDANVDDILVDTDTTIPGLVASLNDLSLADVRTAVGLASANLDTQLADLPTAIENADALLNRDMSAVSDTNSRTPLNALRFLRNKWSVSGTTLTVTEEDDTAVAWTATLTADASANPVVGSDPA